jgi:predicted DNA-binding transcriptional regulator AlpA
MNAKQHAKTPEATPGNEAVALSRQQFVKLTDRFGDKRDVAAMAAMRSTRWVELQMAAGMPHLKLGPRRVRFDLEEVREWLKEKYHQQRRAVAA